jgi:hypothetical protein
MQEGTQSARKEKQTIGDVRKKGKEVINRKETLC